MNTQNQINDPRTGLPVYYMIPGRLFLIFRVFVFS
jgi:hypothetical protein